MGFENEIYRDRFLMQWFICISLAIVVFGILVGNGIVILLGAVAGMISTAGLTMIDDHLKKFMEERKIMAVKSHFSDKTANKGRFHGTKGAGKPAKSAKHGKKNG